jgi:hypothetical protein
MPRRVAASSLVQGWWTNWRQNQAGGIGYFQPTTHADLVASVVAAESEDRHVKAVGSSWSFTAAARPDEYWIDLRQLNRILPTDMARLVRPELQPRASQFVHVQAGIRLHELNVELWRRRKAMPTLGGSQGQSLGGAISTGTHGGDFDRPPLADCVRAIHLVGRGGRPYWIEPSAGDDALTAADVLPIAEWSGDIRIVRDDATFRAVLVSLGRCGVIYSYVIEVVDRYDLEEFRYAALWAGPSVKGLEVVRNTLRAETVQRGLEDGWPGQTSPLGSPNPLRYLQVDIDPNDVDAAYVTKRWATAPGARVDSPPSPPATTLDRDAHFIGYARTNEHAWSDLIYLETIRGQFRGNRYTRTIRDRSYYVMAGRPDPYPDYASYMDAFWRHMWRVDSMEFFFNAGSADYLQFVDDLLDVWHTSPGRKPGYISLRFMQCSKATLAMQRWPVTVSVECTFLHGFPGTELGVQNTLALGRRRGAIFHWGQLTPPGYGRRLDDLFGPALTEWKIAIATLGVVPDDMFSTDYSQTHQLEPSVRPRQPSDLLLLYG